MNEHSLDFDWGIYLEGICEKSPWVICHHIAMMLPYLHINRLRCTCRPCLRGLRKNIPRDSQDFGGAFQKWLGSEPGTTWQPLSQLVL